MNALLLHEFHAGLNARFVGMNGWEVVAHYGDVLAEHTALRETVGILDLSFRSRLCLLGADRKKFLHGQVTNDVNALKSGEGCYAALITGKGKMQSDLFIFCLENELLLDFEPGLAQVVTERLEKFIIADDVQIADVAPHYGLLSVQGPQAAAVIGQLELGLAGSERPLAFSSSKNEAWGEVYLMNQSRVGQAGFDLFVPVAAVGELADKLVASAQALGGCACGWEALEIARIENGVPRFGADMDESNLPPETGAEARMISYSKGCYIGQEVMARIRTYGQVAKALRGLQLTDGLKTLPSRGDKLFKEGKEVGCITSATISPVVKANLALGYVRREANQVGTELTLRTKDGDFPAKIVKLPFG